MWILYKNFKITSGSYIPATDSYIIDIYYNFSKNLDYELIAEINFYDEDLEKPMDIELVWNHLIPLNDFMEVINISINEIKKIIIEKSIKKEIF